MRRLTCVVGGRSIPTGFSREGTGSRRRERKSERERDDTREYERESWRERESARERKRERERERERERTLKSERARERASEKESAREREGMCVCEREREREPVSWRMSSSWASARDLRFSASVMFRISALDDNLQPTTTSVIQSVSQSICQVSQSARGQPARHPQHRASVPTLPTTTRVRPHPPNHHTPQTPPSQAPPRYLLPHDVYLSTARYLSIWLYLSVCSCTISIYLSQLRRRIRAPRRRPVRAPPRHLFARTDRICTVIVFEATLLLCRARARRSGRVTQRGGALELRRRGQGLL